MSEADIDPAAFLPPGVALEAATTEPRSGREPVDLAALTRIEAEFTAVEAALAAIDQGTYGTCLVCGEAIDPALLDADPVRRGCSSHPVAGPA